MSLRALLFIIISGSLRAENASGAIEVGSDGEGSDSQSPGDSTVQFLSLMGFVDPDLSEIFNFKLSQIDLIAHFKGKMREVSPGCEVGGQFLSEVLFDFLSFRPFSRIKAIEVDEERIASQLSEVELIKKTGVDSNQAITSYSEDESLSEKLMLLIDGAVKASRTFHPPSLRIIESFLLQTSFPNKDKVLSYIYETRSKQPRLKALYNLQNNSLSKYLQLVEALAALPGFQKFNFADIEEWKFRFLELARLMKPLSHYVGNQTKAHKSLVAHVSEQMKTINLKVRDFLAQVSESGTADRQAVGLCLKTVNRMENIFEVTSRYVLEVELDYKRKQLVEKHPFLFQPPTHHHN